MRRGLVVALTLALGSLALSACGSSTAPSTEVVGQPSLQISVPLQVAACEGVGRCFAVGTTGLDTEPTSAAEMTTNSQHWSAIAAPSAPSTILTSAGCWANGCIYAGSNAGGDVIWHNVNANGISVTSAPTGGLGVTAVSCFATNQCAALDTSANGSMRVSFTTNGAASWSAPKVVSAPAGATGLSISCIDAQHCVIGESGVMSAGAGAAWVATSDGFATTNSGSSFPTGASWTQLTDLSCTTTRCVGRLSDSDGHSKVVVANLTGQWFATNPRWGSHLNVPITLDALACTPALRCVATGSSGDVGAVWVSDASGTWSALSLKYVGNPLTYAACSKSRCVAVNNWTVTAFAP